MSRKSIMAKNSLTVGYEWHTGSDKMIINFIKDVACGCQFSSGNDVKPRSPQHVCPVGDEGHCADSSVVFHIKHQDAIVDSLNKKFANKVVHNLGLCIALWDITKLEDSFIFPGDGASHTIVHFRFVVFRPFVDEILTGKIKSCSKEGVHVSLGFFDDILIPSDALQHPSRFDEREQLWVWAYATEDGSHDLFMDGGEEIRFRVVDEVFVDMTPTGPEGTMESVDSQEGEAKKAPFTLIGAVSEPGLGCLSWWNS